MTGLSMNNKETTFRILDIIRGTTVDGPGFRTAIYLAGCRHECQGCHNPQSWDENNGKEYTLEEILEIVKEEDFNVTLTGGDPLYNPEKTALLAKEIKALGYEIWLYTGYLFEDILKSETLSLPLEYIDNIVDGPFVEDLRDTDLQFRGSSNQRIINLREIREKNMD